MRSALAFERSQVEFEQHILFAEGGGEADHLGEVLAPLDAVTQLFGELAAQGFAQVVVDFVVGDLYVIDHHGAGLGVTGGLLGVANRAGWGEGYAAGQAKAEQRGYKVMQSFHGSSLIGCCTAIGHARHHMVTAWRSGKAGEGLTGAGEGADLAEWRALHAHLYRHQRRVVDPDIVDHDGFTDVVVIGGY